MKPLPSSAVILMWEPEGDSRGVKPAPFMLRIRPPAELRPVAFKMREMAEPLVHRMNLGRRMWVEPASEVIARYARYFAGGEIVYFSTKKQIGIFVNDVSQLPLRKL